ncbi:MAG: UDP-N-acetylmuramoyl-tripeptide--D-alanyl-D-alanine ligase [Pseudomonadota bacterium]
MRSNAGPYKVRDILKATSGRLCQGNIESFFDGICTDSRELRANDLFVPLKGKNFDGDSFVLPALNAGAGGSLINCDIRFEIPFHLSKLVLIKVQDTLRALTDLASAHRETYPIPLVAITGSSGKTTVKEMIGTIVGESLPFKKTQGNLNNLIGLPMTVLDIRPQDSFAIVEAGINQPGEMSLLAKAASPNIAVITSVGLAHLEGLGTLENIANEKFKLVEALSVDGLGIIPSDCDLLNKRARESNSRIMTFGLNGGDVRAEKIKIGNPTSFEIVGPPGRMKITWDILGSHNICNALAAFAVCSELRISNENIRLGLEKFKPPAWRMEVFDLGGSRKLIRDYYNANPISMKAAIETLVENGSKCSTLAILGDMMELGAYSSELHRSLGQIAARKGLDMIIFVGSYGSYFARGFLTSGGDEKAIHLFQDKEQAWKLIRDSVGKFERILVKGSRSMKMEIIADRIEKEM